MAPVALAQQALHARKVEYTFEIPSADMARRFSSPMPLTNIRSLFTVIASTDYLTIRKEIVDAGTTPAELARRDQDLKLRFLPGFVEGKQEPFNGRLDGVTMSYEFVRTGKPMLGRTYYLQADNRTIYALALYRFARQAEPDSQSNRSDRSHIQTQVTSHS